eukprot:3628858-Pleurochrysis_carterae.AAC.1
MPEPSARARSHRRAHAHAPRKPYRRALHRRLWQTSELRGFYSSTCLHEGAALCTSCVEFVCKTRGSLSISSYGHARFERHASSIVRTQIARRVDPKGERTM